MKACLIIIYGCCMMLVSNAQDSILRYADLPSKVTDEILKEQKNIEQKIEQNNQAILDKLKKQEAKICKKLKRFDSSKAKRFYGNMETKYAALERKINDPESLLDNSKVSEYIPRLDSLQTMLKFLEPLSTQKEKLGEVTKGITAVKGKLGEANTVQSFITERQQALNDFTSSYTDLPKKYIDKYLARYSKECYYYKEKIATIKEDIKDPEKLECLALEMLNKLPAFKKFMAENSELAQLFPMPANYGTVQALAGLQTRTMVQSQLSQQVGSAMSGVDPMAYIQQQIQGAQSSISALKDKAASLGLSPNTENMAMPDFKPNTQKTKRFLQRIEYGINIENRQRNEVLPDATDIGLFAGYRFTDDIVAGVGIAGRIGWGKLVKDIELTGQGMDVRSYIDMRLKGNVWISGGFEYNYYKDYDQLSQLVNIDAWQKSGLIGLSKKFAAGKKTGKVQLLWDFLSYSQVPRPQPFKFRINYCL